MSIARQLCKLGGIWSFEHQFGDANRVVAWQLIAHGLAPGAIGFLTVFIVRTDWPNAVYPEEIAFHVDAEVPNRH